MATHAKDQYLKQLGVTESLFTLEELACLDRDGYLSLGCLLDGQQLAEIHALIDKISLDEGENTGSELLESKNIRHPTEPGVTRLADLVNKGAAFDRFYTHPKVLSAVAHVLQCDFKLSSLDYQVCNAIWLLDDFTEHNGATRVVPGTHLFNELPGDVLEDPSASHPLEKLFLAPAGTVVVINSHLWHGGTINKSKLPRRAMHSYYCQYDAPQQLDQRRYLRPETSERLDKSVLTLLDVGEPRSE